MQSVVGYGRLIARAFVSGFQSDHQLRNTFDIRKENPLQFVSASAGFPKVSAKPNIQKKWTFGDDAYFIAADKVVDVIGVADGVGGWRNYGVDPSAFSRTLMSICERLVHEGKFKPQFPAECIAAGYEELLEQKIPLTGSSTACIVALHREERTIYAANLGDSGYLVVRDQEVIHRSQEQQHYFNTPFQLAVAPPTHSGLILSDSPDMAETYSFRVEEGDIILLGSDGLFDNMNEEMLLEHLYKVKDHNSVKRSAHKIAERAHYLSLDPDYMSPFSISASEAGIPARGGKPDDITLIVARISELPEPADNTFVS